MDHLKSEFKSKEEELQTLGAEIKILESRLDLEKDIRQEEMDTSRSKSKTNQLLRFSLSTNARCVSASGVCRAAAATGPSLCVGKLLGEEASSCKKDGRHLKKTGNYQLGKLFLSVFTAIDDRIQGFLAVDANLDINESILVSDKTILSKTAQSKPSVVPPTANSSFLEAMSRGTV
ncbi:hypothetical protein J6590_058275 [Homalodisca vitripennis]|nr:hypothetical protein J6590_058275 [Homalodisca vitripennis]